MAGQASAFLQSIFFSFMLDVKTTDKDGILLPEDQLLLKEQDRSWWTFFVFIIISTVALILAIFVREDLRRLTFSQDGDSNADVYRRLDGESLKVVPEGGPKKSDI